MGARLPHSTPVRPPTRRIAGPVFSPTSMATNEPVLCEDDGSNEGSTDIGEYNSAPETDDGYISETESTEIQYEGSYGSDNGSTDMDTIPIVARFERQDGMRWGHTFEMHSNETELDEDNRSDSGSSDIAAIPIVACF
ncbi:hypothetical protein Hypma_003938 [Hypsizygus marmoreus]|uniref:Uncharacterized protein n=1 Tax=Hypsizygus marmoreus TaxID=39966 RepID=A0A369J0Y9_HYPMA|nr:hypothetical protein Hypma_003938 [Hypsizygus marmoreus]